MSLAQITSSPASSAWSRFESFIPWMESLHFSLETQDGLSPFREQVLNYIYRATRGLSDGLLESAIVEAVSEPDEEDSLHLHLAMTIDMHWEELDVLHDLILARIAEWSREWSFEDQENYGRWIFFSLTPSHI